MSSIGKARKCTKYLLWFHVDSICSVLTILYWMWMHDYSLEFNNLGGFVVLFKIKKSVILKKPMYVYDTKTKHIHFQYT